MSLESYVYIWSESFTFRNLPEDLLDFVMTTIDLINVMRYLGKICIV